MSALNDEFRENGFVAIGEPFALRDGPGVCAVERVILDALA